MSVEVWTPDSWRKKKAEQLPTYPDQEKLAEIEMRLATYPPLVPAGESLALKNQLARVSDGHAFLLQGGDCAESFGDFKANTIRDNLRILLQMAVVLTYRSKLPVIKVGRVAGQFAKPRSSKVEIRNGVTLPTYRGDIINGYDFTPESRNSDPVRMERAYVQSAATLNLLHSFARDGYSDLREVHEWNLNFVRKSAQIELYETIAQRLKDVRDSGEIEVYTSHEALLLPYEQALTRREGDWYCGSGHQLWIGDRTRQIDGAHVEFLRGVNNPIGIKCGPSLRPEELITLLDILNPTNEKGRITLINRLGYQNIESHLPPLISRVQREGRSVVWSCDPMHGNTITASNGFKTRNFSHVLSEMKKFFEIHKLEGTYAGGVHFEMTSRDVVECLGGDQAISEKQLAEGPYETLCDPRLNASQSLELAFQLCQYVG